MRVLLVSTYELGRQPFGLASPAAWLRARGHQVTCADLAVTRLPLEAASQADFVAFYLPMHTATRLAVPVIERVRRENPGARLCAYGLYAGINEKVLHRAGVPVVIAGEFEQALVDAVEGRSVAGVGSMERLSFIQPDRADLPVLQRYASVRQNGQRRVTGYTEASRGCKHLCRHCPVVPVYQGVFRVVPPEVVLADVRQQVQAGAQHITFGDPDFFNGPGHARRVVEGLHREFPDVTYDVTVKVEHLLRHAGMLAVLRETGCAFVTSAVESVDDAVLERLAKGHTRADFERVTQMFREAELTLAPTFIAFTPWTTREGYRDLLRVVAELGLIENVAPVQLALRLLITSGSKLLELPEVRELAEDFDAAALVYHWHHPDAEMDALAQRTLRLVAAEQKRGRSRREIFAAVWQLANGTPFHEDLALMPRATVPYLDEPWYC